ncbi:MAG: hypothetical protein P4L82_10785 [Ancalomicrobiaceae bacterium]|nr:hypothetical protein [Ancalomicrobiaceae bacterium]
MSETDGKLSAPQEAIAAYKEILKNVLDMRPSGMRRHLAQRLGSNPSFISQIANPAYPTPIPAGHVEAIIEICHFSAAERERFLAAYEAAHPNRAHLLRSAGEGRTLTLTVPDLGSIEDNTEFDRAVTDLVARMSRLLKSD